MGFRSPVGPVSISSVAGIEELPDGSLRVYSGRLASIILDAPLGVRAIGLNGLSVEGSVQAGRVFTGYPGGMVSGRELLPVRGGKATATTDALGNVTFPHGGPGAPTSVTLTLDGATVLDAEKMTAVVRATGATNVTARIYSPAGALAAGLSVTVHFTAVFPIA